MTTPGDVRVSVERDMSSVKWWCDLLRIEITSIYFKSNDLVDMIDTVIKVWYGRQFGLGVVPDDDTQLRDFHKEYVGPLMTYGMFVTTIKNVLKKP